MPPPTNLTLIILLFFSHYKDLCTFLLVEFTKNFLSQNESDSTLFFFPILGIYKDKKSTLRMDFLLLTYFRMDFFFK